MKKSENTNASYQIINNYLHSTPGIEVDQKKGGRFIDICDLARAHTSAFGGFSSHQAFDCF